MYTVAVTSQGQITIPAKIRRQLGLDKTNKATVKLEDNKIIVESIPDILSLAGVFHHKAIKNKSIDEIIKLEEKAWEEAVVEKYIKNQKRPARKKSPTKT